MRDYLNSFLMSIFDLHLIRLISCSYYTSEFDLSSGIYYYQLKSDNYFVVNKMLLIK